VPTRIQLCRRLQIEWEGERPALPGNQGRLLFAYLVLHRARPVRRDELLEVLWSGEGAPASPEAVLSAPLSRLRKALGPGRLEGRGELVLALPADAWIDWEVAFDGLREAHAAVSEGRWRAAWEAARGALTIADGGLLPGLEARWIDVKRAELAELRVELLEVVATAGARLGGPELPHAEQAARAAVDAAPFRESARAALIEVLRARGNVADALRAFEDARTLLREELGATPGPLLQRLHHELLRAEPAPVPSSLPARLAAVLETPLVGRREPLARLRAELRGVREGRGGVVLVTGEGGIGKTRLIAETAAVAEGFMVLYGRCEEDQLFPFGPWVEMLERVELPEEPALRRLLPEHALADPGDPESELRQLYGAVVALLRRLSERRPLLVIIDDLHWADRSSLLLGRHLVRTLGAGRVLMLGSYRDTELGARHPLLDVLADLERDRPLPRIPLRGLDAAEVAELAGIEFEAARELREETHGNPFFVQQLVRHRRESGADRVSAGLRDVIVRRVARLPGEAGRVLGVAALVGREFELGLVELVVDVGEDDLLDLFDAAVAAGILDEVADAPGRYSFVHALVRTTLEHELSATRRARLHRRIARAIEGRHGDRLDPWLGELARHYTAAGPEETQRAVVYGVRAAEQATGRLAYEEATELLEGALATHERDPSGDEWRRASLLVDLAMARWRQGRLPESRDTFRAATEAARRAGAAELFARAALGHAGGPWDRYGTEDTASAALLDEALRMLPEEDSVLRTQLLARLGAVLYFSGDSGARGSSLINAAVVMAHRFDDDDALATALSAAQFAYWRPAQVEARLTLGQELVEVAERLGNPQRIAEALMWRAGALLTLCRLDEADADLERHAELSQRLAHPELRTHSVALRGMRAALEGRWDEADRAAAGILETGGRLVPILALQEHGGLILQLRGEQLRLEELIERFGELARTITGLPAWRVPLAWAHVQAGRRDRALAELTGVRRDGFAALPRDVNFDVALAMLAHVADELGDAALAAEVEPLLRPLSAYWVVLGVGAATLGPFAYSLGVCNLLLGRFDAAVADLELALVKCAAMRARPYEAHASLRRARALARRDRPGDAERAAALERAAIAIGHELDMPRLLRDAGAQRRAA
jgi:DNA-binding SARP family transcriptional activator